MTTRALGDFAVKAKNLNPASFSSEEFDLLSIPAYDKGYPEIVRGEQIGSAKQLVESGDIMIAKIVPHIKRVWIVPPSGGRRQLASSEWIVFRNSQLHGPWLRHLLFSEGFHRQFMQTVAGVGGSLLRARPAGVMRISIDVPEFSEQRRIADILDKADALRTKRREAIAHLDTLSQSIFHEMFSAVGGDFVTLREASVRFVSGRNLVGTGEYSHPTKRVLKVSAVSSGIFDGSQSKPLPLRYEPPAQHLVTDGDLIVTRASGTKSLIGVATIVQSIPKETYLPDKLWKVAFNSEKLHPNFFRYLTRTAAYREYVSNASSGAAGVSNISQAKLLEFKFVLPSIESQLEFARQVELVDRQKRLGAAELAQLDILFLSLQNRAFKGEL